MNPFIRMAFRTDACFTALQPVLLPPPKKKGFSAQENPLSQKQEKKKTISRTQKELYEKKITTSQLKLTSALMVPDKLFHYTHICVM